MAIKAEHKKYLIYSLTVVFLLRCLHDVTLYFGFFNRTRYMMHAITFNKYTAAVDALGLIFLLWRCLRLAQDAGYKPGTYRPSNLSRAEKKTRKD